MADRGQKVWCGWLVIGLAALHTLILAFHTLPSALVPDKLRMLSGVYARPLFHQQWRLFAPDPPACHAEIQISGDGITWRSLYPAAGHYLERRMVRTITHHVALSLPQDGVHPLMREALYEACQPFGDPLQLRYRLMEQCVTDPQMPHDRELAITPFTP